MRLKRVLLPALFTISMLSLAVVTRADISYTFVTDTLTGSPGDTLHYSAIFTNYSSTDTVDITALDLALGTHPAGSDLYIAPSLSPFSLMPKEVKQVDFSIALAPEIAQHPDWFTNYDALTTVSLSGADDPIGQAIYFSIAPASAPIPEPAFYQMSALLALGGAGVWRARRKR